jgi:hypothetical protein
LLVVGLAAVLIQTILEPLLVVVQEAIVLLLELLVAGGLLNLR